ncbi:MAG: UvrD-helicase domain-containing protein [Bdellovibrionaceae bacterium]|nr:UvrD-helicase domain-containing protein [Pseudobdellovibrionaceae bacterium]
MSQLEQITQSLNPEQARGVETSEGPLLILAGAGSGKTRVLTHRMAWILSEGLASADEILVVTFTNKAAREMEHRIYKILSDLGFAVYSDLWISTFHSFCVRVLKRHITQLGYKPFFTIYDPSDQLSQLKKVLRTLNINEKLFPAKAFQQRISRAKMLGLSPQAIENKGVQADGRKLMDPRSLEVYRLYESEMKKANALDFDDLLMKTYELFMGDSYLLGEYQNKFRYIMVDEYQDTNHIQYLIVQALARKHRNLCVVGDEDQSIYSWRGADISNILDFEKDFPEANIVKLEENYRSSGNIVKASSWLIKNNTQRKDKTLRTTNPDGDKIVVREESNEYDEARFVAKTIESLMGQGNGSYNDYSVFYRTNAQSRVLEEQLRTFGIPYKIIGGIRFYERMEIKDILCYLRLAMNPADDIALKRVINVPTRGLGKTTLEKLEGLAAEKNCTLSQAIEHAINNKLFNSSTTSKLRRFLDLIIEFQADVSKFRLSEFYHVVLDRTEYLTGLKVEETPEAQARIENLEEFDNAITQFEKERGEDGTLQSFLEEMALVSDQDTIDNQVNSVTLMTLHISKGLEFPYVFVVGLEENLFPSIRSDDTTEDDIEEERRLAYVGMTRAREKLFLTYAQSRRVWGQEQMNSPSRFIRELPLEQVDFQSSIAQSSFAARYANRAISRVASRTPGGGSVPRVDSVDFDSQTFPDYEAGSSPQGGSGYQKGMRVRHPTFGLGSVYAIEGSGEDMKVSIVFSDQTLKKFVVKYARLERM